VRDLPVAGGGGESGGVGPAGRGAAAPAEHSLPDAENTALNELFAATTLGGRGPVKADLDAETMEMLHTALSGLSQPEPAADGTPDTRPAALRRAEPFTELLRRYLNSGHSPTEGYGRPNRRYSSTTKTSPPPVRTTRTTPLPMRHPPRTPPPAPPLTWIGPISAASARRIACDCELTAILIDGEGVPLKLGRNQRLVSAHQRRALIARDHGCAFPGCNRPPASTQAHHIRHWINGGTTDLAKLKLR